MKAGVESLWICAGRRMAVREEILSMEIVKEAGRPMGLGFVSRMEPMQGLYISSLSPENQEKNLRIGDRIVSINGREYKSKQEANALVGRIEQGRIQVQVARGALTRLTQSPSSAAETKGEQGTKEISLEMERDEGQPLGIYVDDQLVVTRVMSYSLTDGLLQLGDVVKAVNGKPVKDKEQLYQYLRRAFPMLQLNVIRDSSRKAQLESSLLPVDLEKLVRRRAGFEYLLVEVDWPAEQQRALGLALENRLNRVVVTDLKQGSVCADKFRVYDRLLTINHSPISDKDVAKQLIISCNGKWRSAVERPVTAAAVAEMKESAASATATTVVGVLPTDVQVIADAQRDLQKQQQLSGTAAPQPILRRTPSTGNLKIKIDKQHQEVPIPSDVDPNKNLRHVPRG